ncbi:MAG: hypothetical protein DRI61_16305, partial [Chloroflexi bacterium]
RLAQQMAFFMAKGDRYVDYLLKRDIPEEIYNSKTKLEYSEDFRTSRGWIENEEKRGWYFDGENPDLGPVNGPFPLQELIKALYIFSGFMTFTLTKQTDFDGGDKFYNVEEITTNQEEFVFKGEDKDGGRISRLIETLRDKDSEELDRIGWQPQNQEEEILYLIVKQSWDELVKIGAPAISYLIRALKDENWHVRQPAAYALGEIGSQKAIPYLIKALKDENWYVRHTAAEALGKIGLSAIPHLIKVLEDKDSDVRKAAAEALDQIEWQPQNQEEKILYLIAKQGWDELVKIGVSAIPYLIKVLKDEDSDVRQTVAEALVKIGTPAIPYLIKALKDKNWCTRYEAAKALGKIGFKEVVSRLREALRDKNADVQPKPFSISDLSSVNAEKVNKDMINQITEEIADDNKKASDAWQRYFNRWRWLVEILGLEDKVGLYPVIGPDFVPLRALALKSSKDSADRKGMLIGVNIDEAPPKDWTVEVLKVAMKGYRIPSLCCNSQKVLGKELKGVSGREIEAYERYINIAVDAMNIDAVAKNLKKLRRKGILKDKKVDYVIFKGTGWLPIDSSQIAENFVEGIQKKILKPGGYFIVWEIPVMKDEYGYSRYGSEFKRRDEELIKILEKRTHSVIIPQDIEEKIFDEENREQTSTIIAGRIVLTSGKFRLFQNPYTNSLRQNSLQKKNFGREVVVRLKSFFKKSTLVNNIFALSRRISLNNKFSDGGSVDELFLTISTPGVENGGRLDISSLKQI